MSDILLIEDNHELAKLITAFLQKEGFSLCHVATGEAAIAWIKHHQTKMILLDIMLPGMDGFAVCQAIRTTQNTPIMIISAKSMRADKLLGFELGADDYIEKPVDPDILCAKVKAVFYRIYETQTNIIQSGALRIELDAHKVYLHEQIVEVNTKEFELLNLLLQNEGKTLHKDYLFNQIWGMDSDSENQTLTVHIKMLRTKIEEDARHPKRIQTVWGVGYRYEKN